MLRNTNVTLRFRINSAVGTVIFPASLDEKNRARRRPQFGGKPWLLLAPGKKEEENEKAFVFCEMQLLCQKMPSPCSIAVVTIMFRNLKTALSKGLPSRGVARRLVSTETYL